MAKKPRTPPPPRKVQAPKQRHDAKDPAVRQKAMLYGFAGAGLVGLAVVVIVIFASGGKSGDAAKGSDAKVAAAMKAAGCTVVNKPIPKPKVGGKDFHADVPTLDTKVKWSTFPTSGGSHYGAWAIWGFYTEPVLQVQVGHNLEHGGVVLWWGPDVPQETVDQLRAFYDDSPNSMIGTPVPGLGKKVAISAWTGDASRYFKDGYYGVGHLATCATFDESAFTTFRDAYRGHGPEGVPADSNQPGSGPG